MGVWGAGSAIEGLGWVEVGGIVVPRNERWYRRKKQTKGLRQHDGGLGSAWQALVWTMKARWGNDRAS